MSECTVEVKTVKLLLPPPVGGWDGAPSAVYADLSGVPWKRRIESAGKAFERWLHRKHGGEDVASEEEEEEEEDQENHIGTEAKSRKKSDLLRLAEDPYEVLGLGHIRWKATDKQIKKAYKQMATLHHPDKKADKDDTTFKLINKCYELLSNPKKRRAFDSQDFFDDSIPTGNEPGDFFSIFVPVFERNSRWSLITPVPSLGDENTPWEQVSAFYDFWFNFKSWRDFSFVDEYDPEGAESRDEKRWMERQNEKQRARKRKEENARILRLVETAHRKDPRVIRHTEEEKTARKRAKQAKREAVMKERAERERAEAEERARIEVEERRKREEEQRKRATEKKALRDTRAKLRELATAPSSPLPAAYAALPATALAEDVDMLCFKLPFERLMPLVTALESNASDAAVQFQKEAKALREQERLATEQAAAKKKSQSGEAERPWTEEELSLLARAVAKYPPGTANRWKIIADFIGTRTEAEVITATKKVAKAATVDSAKHIAVMKDDFARYKATKKVSDQTRLWEEQQRLQSPQASTVELATSTAATATVATTTASPPPVARPAAPTTTTTSGKPKTAAATTTTVPAEGGQAAPSPTATPAAEWTADEQRLLEQGLRTYPASDKERWTKIAAVVKTKTKKECIERFKYLAAALKQQKPK